MARAVKALDLEPLRALLAEPAEWSWDALCELLSGARWEASAERWLPIASAALDAGWPDALRVWPHRWLKKGAAPSALRLVRTLRLGAQGKAAHALIFTHLAQLDAAAAPPLTRLELVTEEVRRGVTPASWMDEAQVAALGELVGRCALESLVLSGEGSAAVWEMLVRSPGLAALRTLHVTLGVNPHLLAAADAQRALTRLLKSRTVGALVSVRLDWAWGGAGELQIGVARGLATRHAATLSQLELEIGLKTPVLNTLGAASWAALRELRVGSDWVLALELLYAWIAAAPALEELEVRAPLARSAQDWSPEGLDGPRLRALSLSHTWLTPELLGALLASPVCAALRALTLRGVAPSEALMAPLARLELEQLSLICDAPDATWASWMAAPHAALRELSLSVETLAPLCAARLPALRRLYVAPRQLSPSALDALEASAWFAQLEQLRIDSPTPELHAQRAALEERARRRDGAR